MGLFLQVNTKLGRRDNKFTYWLLVTDYGFLGMLMRLILLYEPVGVMPPRSPPPFGNLNLLTADSSVPSMLGFESPVTVVSAAVAMLKLCMTPSLLLGVNT